jgi:hypothetical protein
MGATELCLEVDALFRLVKAAAAVGPIDAES